MSNHTIPVVDVSGMVGAAAFPDETVASLRRACDEYGFFYLTGHGISTATFENILSLARRFFQGPQEEKDRIKRRSTQEGGDGARGYQEIRENVTAGCRDYQEAINFVREVPEQRDPTGCYEVLKGPNLWPECPKEFKSDYQEYFERLLEVGKTVARLFGFALELDPLHMDADQHTEDSDFFVRNTDCSFWMSRVVGYPPMCDKTSEMEGDGVSCGEHTDYGCFTMLLNDKTPNTLEVLMKDGTWVYVNPVNGALIVNIGDMMERWTNGRWKSTRHRVVHREGKYRVSVPFFYEPNFECAVKPLAKFVSDTNTSGECTTEPYGSYIERMIRKTYP